jgi:predicted MPP superfamily phosphohydrolase
MMQPKPILNILHLTDLHFRQNDNPAAKAHRHIVLQALLRQLRTLLEVKPDQRDQNWQWTHQSWSPDIIAISGDLAYSGLRSEYEEVGKFLVQLRDALGNSKLPIVATPGNHDRDTTYTAGTLYPNSSIQADDWLSIERQQPEWSSVLDAKGDPQRIVFSRSSLVTPFQAFQTFCEDTNDMLRPTGIPGLEYLTGCADWKKNDDLRVEFISVNSAWFCDHRNVSDARNLWLGLPLLEWLHYKNPRKSDVIRIALVHHPKEWLHEEECNSYGDRPNTYRFLAENSDLILSGHVHGSLEPPSTAYSSALVITGGASYVGGRWRNNFSMLQMDLLDRSLARRGFEYDPREQAWVESLHSQTIQSIPTRPVAGASKISPADKNITPHQLSGKWHHAFWIEGRSVSTKWLGTITLTALNDTQLSGQTERATGETSPGHRKYDLRGELKDGFLTGTWNSISDSEPVERGGSFQLRVISNLELRGRWLGFDRGHDINVGQWVFQRESDG